jgi:hypothetical protein
MGNENGEIKEEIVATDATTAPATVVPAADGAEDEVVAEDAKDPADAEDATVPADEVMPEGDAPVAAPEVE